MDADATALRSLLLREVAGLTRRNRGAWAEPIVDFLSGIRASGLPAVFFGGTLRSLLAARLFGGRRGRPRDVDIVVSGICMSDLEDRFKRVLHRRTRFGGLQLCSGGWRFDVWPVQETWLPRDGGDRAVSFADLPSTTTFNLEAIAVETFPSRGRSRRVYSGDGRFFGGMLSRTLELNREDNPYPGLTVLRGIAIAGELGFSLGPRFARYVRRFGPPLGDREIEDLQLSHYGYHRIGLATLRESISRIESAPRGEAPVAIPALGQTAFWGGHSGPPSTVRVRCAARDASPLRRPRVP